MYYKSIYLIWFISFFKINKFYDARINLTIIELYFLIKISKLYKIKIVVSNNYSKRRISRFIKNSNILIDFLETNNSEDINFLFTIPDISDYKLGLYFHQINNISIKYYSYKIRKYINGNIIRIGKYGDLIITANICKYGFINYWIYSRYSKIRSDNSKICNNLHEFLNINFINFYQLIKNVINTKKIFIHSHTNSFKKISFIFLIFKILNIKCIFLNNSKQYGHLHIKTDNHFNDSRYVIICPLSNEKAKDLSTDNLILLVNIIKTKKLIPVLVGDNKIKLNLEGLINLSGETDWNDLKNLIIKSRYVVSVDTSIFHLALFYQKNVFLLMSSRLLETKRWIPNNFNNYKYNNVECKGCNASTCKISDDSYCINSNFKNIDFSFLN